MTPGEVQTWIEYHHLRFPDAINKLRSRPRVAEHFEIWNVTLAEVSLELAKSLTDSMFRGDIKHPAHYELDSLPGMLLESHREHKRALRGEMSEWEQDSNQARKSRISDGKTYGMFRRILRLVEHAKEEQRRVFVEAGNDDRNFRPDRNAAIETATVRFRETNKLDDLGYRDAVRCLLCNDTGLVMCWSPGTMRDALAELEVIRWTECGVPCTCNPHVDPSNDSMRINKFARRVWKVGKQWAAEDVPRFDPNKHTPSRGPESKDRLTLWAIRYREAQSAGTFRQLGQRSNQDEWQGEPVA